MYPFNPGQYGPGFFCASRRAQYASSETLRTPFSARHNYCLGHILFPGILPLIFELLGGANE
jgi:hypothetical protein